MTATHGVGTYGNAVGVVTPLDHKMAQLGLVVKTAANTIRPGLFWDGNATIVSGKANMSYDVRAFTAVTSRGATAGAVLLSNDAVFNVVTTAAPGSNSRYDVVYIWPREFSIDGTDSNPVIGVVQGTAAASPTVPSLAAFPGAISLAQILVPAGVTATNSGTTITQTAPFTALADGTVVFRNFTELSAWSSVIQGQPARDLATGVTWRWFDLYNASTNPTGRAAAGWKPWNTSTPVDYYSAGNLVNYTVGPDVPIMTWSAREGRIICEGKLAIVSGSSFSGAFSIKTPSTIPVAAKYTTTSRQDIVGRALYIASSSFPIDVVLQGSTASDRVTLVLENQTGTYPAFASQVTASVPVANAIGYVMTWAFEYDPA